jgi:hypothetical protein
MSLNALIAGATGILGGHMAASKAVEVDQAFVDEALLRGHEHASSGVARRRVKTVRRRQAI